jgi:toxin ParE1/3/4
VKARVIYSFQANDDLRQIVRYLRQHSRPAAKRFSSNVANRLKRLAHSPNLGRDRSEFGVKMRSVVIGDYVVFYHITPKVVTILRILHGSRNIDAIMRQLDWSPPQELNGE